MSYTIKELPDGERPREKAKKYGISKLTDEELIAIVLRTGTNHQSAKDVAIAISSKVEGIKNLEKESIESLKKINGIGEVKAITLFAALELGKRLISNDYVDKSKINGAKDVYFLYENFSTLQQEILHAVFLNSKNQVIHSKTLFKGTINQSVVHPREIFKEAVKYAAVKIILIHNHPSGNASPSREDYTFTRKIERCSEMMDIPLVDHIIIGRKEYFSFYENKLYNLVNGED